MTRMTETSTGEVHWFKPMIGSAVRDAYDRIHAGGVATGKEASALLRFGINFRQVREAKHGPYGWCAEYALEGEWHDFQYYPSSQVHRIEAEEYDRDDYREDDETELESD